MSWLDLLKDTYLSYFSKPQSERVLLRTIIRRRVKSIVEIGIDSVSSTTRMIRVAARKSPGDRIRYTGIDLFEARPQPVPGLTLKQVHRQLAKLDAKSQLMPGDPCSALARAANALVGTDLLIIRLPLSSDEMSRAWFYVPRMLHEGSQVFVALETLVPGQIEFRQVPAGEIASWSKRRRVA